MGFYRKRPVVIEARQLTADNRYELEDWVTSCMGTIYSAPDAPFTIVTLEGRMEATVGDWIIRGVQGEFYPCKPDIFELTYYEAAPSPPDALPPDVLFSGRTAGAGVITDLDQEPD